MLLCKLWQNDYADGLADRHVVLKQNVQIQQVFSKIALCPFLCYLPRWSIPSPPWITVKRILFGMTRSGPKHKSCTTNSSHVEGVTDKKDESCCVHSLYDLCFLPPERSKQIELCKACSDSKQLDLETGKPNDPSGIRSGPILLLLTISLPKRNKKKTRQENHISSSDTFSLKPRGKHKQHGLHR